MLNVADIQQRKIQHIQLALEEGSQAGKDDWNMWALPIQTLPELNLKEVNTGTQLLGKKLSQPLIIASMTGGAEHAEKINTNLAVVAEEKQVALGVGSQRVALEKEEAKKTFAVVRKLAPTTVVLANMGAIQLNYGRTIDDYRRVVEMVEADGLYLHLNAMQEALQPEGDTNWIGIEKEIEKLVKKIGVPVLIKEVGCGIDAFLFKRFLEMGIYAIDVAGVGGTSWTWIEGRRAREPRLTEWFGDWGMPTSQVLQTIPAVMGNTDYLSPRLQTVNKTGRVRIVASGGIRTPVQALKAHLLGADYYSLARPFLQAALESEEAVRDLVTDWEKGMRISLFGIGASDWGEAGKKKLIGM